MRLWSRINPTTRLPTIRGWRCMSSHRSKEEVARDARLANRRARRVARDQLRRGIEPPPEQHRHNVHWEVF